VSLNALEMFNFLVSELENNAQDLASLIKETDAGRPSRSIVALLPAPRQ
jgi:hypothetical protein